MIFGKQTLALALIGLGTMSGCAAAIGRLRPGLAAPAPAPDAVEDPLPSWNDGNVRQAILAFVVEVSKEGGPRHVPIAERIAVFDNDGTLWCEQPIVQLVFAIDRLKQVIEVRPELRDRPSVAAALKGDVAYFEREGEPALAEIIALTHAGMTQGEFHEIAAKFFRTARHPRFGGLLRDATYQPMRELLLFLRANGFKTYLCSGGGVEFMRVVSEELYGIPPEQVIGSSEVLEYQERDGKVVLVKTPKLLTINDKKGKPSGIALQIGRVPIFAAGNVRTGGDIPMLRYSQSGNHTSLQLLINHDDAGREFAYAEKDGGSLDAAREHGWAVVSMKNDWKSVFAPRD